MGEAVGEKMCLGFVGGSGPKLGGQERRVVLLGPLLEPVVVKVELLGYFAPVDWVEEEVRAPLVSRRLLCGRDARPRDPDPLVLVEAPVPVVPAPQNMGVCLPCYQLEACIQ